jgi:hypothetical protein
MAGTSCEERGLGQVDFQVELPAHKQRMAVTIIARTTPRQEPLRRQVQRFLDGLARTIQYGISDKILSAVACT